MKVKLLTISLIFFLLTSLLFSDKKIKEKDLPQKYQDWLRLTKYIILSQEKEVFMQLTTNRDRDIFIEAFWKQRDPTPGTPANEYKEEHIKRFLHANKFFKRGTAREGWMTDMARFYIILGPPVSIERFEGTMGLYPTQVWYYYGDPSKGLPGHFGLVFFQRGGAGEYKLYDPVSDGPAVLMIEGKRMDQTNYEALYEKIMELAPTLALMSLSLIPGRTPIGYQPSPENTIILANILQSPKEDVNLSYATHFLDYKGIVTTEYMTNFIESKTSFALIQDPILGINFMHFSIFPEKISLDYYEPKDQYFCSFKIDVSLRIEDNIIFQYSKNFPFYFPAEDIDRIRTNGISIEDSFPVISGRYKFIILLQNSVGKEFSIFEKEIAIQEESVLPQIFGPFLGYKFQDYDRNQHIPFKILDKKLIVDPKDTFALAEDVSFFFNVTNVDENLWNDGEIKVLINGLREKNPVQKSFLLKLRGFPFNRILTIDHSIPVRELSPDYYEMKLTLVNSGGETIDETNGNFIISPAEHISHPIIQAKSFSLSNGFLYFYMLAHQYERLKDYERAESSFKKAYEMNPDYKKGLIEHAHFLFKIKKYAQSLELVENVKEEENLKFDYYLIKGKAYMGMGQYPEAIENLLEGNKIYNSDIRLLNSLGFCYYKIGEKNNALEVLRASLRLNPGQEEIKKLIEKIERGAANKGERLFFSANV